jgi:hypothetical protein
MRRIARVLVVSTLVVLAALVVFSYSAGTASWRYSALEPARPVGTAGTIDAETAPAGGKVAEDAAAAARAVRRTVDEATLTAKIKAKMAVDDFVKARAVGISTRGSVVTLTGRVQTPAEHDLAVSMARDTAGVTEVIDHIVIEPTERL